MRAGESGTFWLKGLDSHEQKVSENSKRRTYLQMKILKVASSILLLLVAAFVWLAPIGPAPGFFIGGTESVAPESWGDTSEIHEIKLKVENGLLPRVVIIWVVQVENHLYVVGSRGSGWVSLLGQGGPVEMRMGSNTYRMNASPVTENWQMILERYQDKYRPDYPDIVGGFPSIEEAVDTVAVFKLTAR